MRMPVYLATDAAARVIHLQVNNLRRERLKPTSNAAIMAHPCHGASTARCFFASRACSGSAHVGLKDFVHACKHELMCSPGQLQDQVLAVLEQHRLENTGRRMGPAGG
eukprot:1152765-Pelagomonas_calceolata.AAC.2